MAHSNPPLNVGSDKLLGPRLRGAGVWTRHSNYASAEPPGYTRDTAPFEAADVLDMQSREIERLRAALCAAVTALRASTDGVRLPERDALAESAVGWLIDAETEHARLLLGTAWQRDKMGAGNELVVPLTDARVAVQQAVVAERKRCAKLCDDTARALAEMIRGA